MSDTLYICEKPSQGRDVAKILGATQSEDGFMAGNNCIVTWCAGHMLELAPPDHYCPNIKPWRMEILPIIPDNWVMQPNPTRKKQLAVIKKLLKKAQHVVIATDADREGDVIGREILDFYEYKGTIERLWLSALDDASIRKALVEIRPGESTYPLYQAGLGRQRADWLIGMSMTIATSHLFGVSGEGVLSVGRVQSPTLSLIVSRDRAIESFKSADYFELSIALDANEEPFWAKWQAPDDVTDIDNRCLNRQTVDAVSQKIEGKTAVVTHFEDQIKHTAPPVCFSLSSLQKIASSKLGFSAKQTLEVAQSLYEKHKATTYPRSDTGYLPIAQHAEVPQILSALSDIDHELVSLIILCDPENQSPVWNDKKVTAHHGIIPTFNQKVEISRMSKDEFALYDIIRRRYIAQFLGDYTYYQRKADIACEDEKFSATSNTPKTKGWKIAENIIDDEDSAEASQTDMAIPALTEGQQLPVSQTKTETKQTKPPPRFTEGTLIAAMKNIAKFVDDPSAKKTLKETTGIGTEATRADTIEKLLNRNYITRNKKALISTERGRGLVDILPAQMTDPATTAIWEQELESIAQGEGDLNDFLSDQEEILEFMLEDLVKIKQEKGNVLDAGPKYPCPKCESPMARKKSKNGYFWGCSTYPNCSGIMQDKQGKPVASAQPQVSDIDCPNCDAGKLIKRKGKKKGYWWGCSNYPECQSTFFDQNGNPNLTQSKQKA